MPHCLRGRHRVAGRKLAQAFPWRRGGLAALSTLALAGCGSLLVASGLATRLDKLPVASISAALSPAAAIAPGQSAALVITATLKDGRTLATRGAGHGKLLFDSFTFDTHLAQLSDSGIVTLPADPRRSDGQTPHLHIAVNGHPDVVADLDIPVRYDFPYVVNYAGGNGLDGMRGSDGDDGRNGAEGGYDPHPAPGGRGGDGAPGRNGGDGQNGWPGPDVELWVRLRPGPPQLLQVGLLRSPRGTAADAPTTLFLIDPEGGSLTVNTRGGNGGAGGRGGHGGHGGAGGGGWPPGTAGMNGPDGMPGQKGADGRAGRFIVHLDPQALPYLNRILLDNRSGNRGEGPPPKIDVEPVPPLW